MLRCGRLVFDGLQSHAFALVQQSWAQTSHGCIRSARNAFAFFLEEMRQQGRRDVLWRPLRWGMDLQASLRNELAFMAFAVWMLEGGLLAPSTVSSYLSLVGPRRRRRHWWKLRRRRRWSH